MASTASSPSTFITVPNFSKTCRGSIFKKKKPFNFVSKKVVPCKANNGAQNNAESCLNRFDRRDILLGLVGSLYGATNLVGGDPFCTGSPNSCPRPVSLPAAHLVDSRYLKKLEQALRRMRELDEDDLRSFMQQANVHCAYQNDAYPQTLFPSQQIQVHNSCLFSPFRKLYLYFFERILGKLINNLDFAIPYWK
ncbi:hypothetical protein PVK06_021567 [Gossypium arboreum]|uniref:Tyrosinase copper-binding domain-containing protein n=1 Tax=Gossypium arboreum TaxID=29729 RepID=A0ABR0PQU5_GOSAR|nr:hypothetical protein PVK06_021567 [Gossypium arboreum]